LFRSLAQKNSSIPLLAILPEMVDDETLELVSESATDFLLWPFQNGELRHRLERILGEGARRSEFESAHRRLMDELGMEQFVGKHPVFEEAIRSLPLIAKSDLPVLIAGPTGTGKELCARGIHHLSKRRGQPFIAVDCGAIPDHLFENELFGHARGAFTDAHADQKGLISLANGGTLFLDEVDALSLGAQAKLLRFLQERTFRPLGSEKFLQADVNVIAATNRDIEECVRERKFRSDLYFRLNVLRVELPSLTRRPTDIALLARHFLRTHCSHLGAKLFTPAALRKLETHDWPGNVRELLNVVQRAAVLSEGAHILPAAISFSARESSFAQSEEDFQEGRSRAIETFEKRYVEDLLHKHRGNVTHAALEAGKDRRAFGRLKKKYSIEY
ncbi:MAG TPA: sigma-54 dependent transcriptional regulator, partial [Pyrinomonadaceae bacterium]|nr:sigma-54 dependent transcriptional regulator [Pyrinomonadaceae bacterium]